MWATEPRWETRCSDSSNWRTQRVQTHIRDFPSSEPTSTAASLPTSSSVEAEISACAFAGADSPDTDAAFSRWHSRHCSVVSKFTSLYFNGD